MTKRKSDAIVPLPRDYHDDDDAQLQDEMDALVKEKFPPLPPWVHEDLIWFQFQSGSNEADR